jgi:DNA-binding response OmpR family regulator
VLVAVVRPSTIGRMLAAQRFENIPMMGVFGEALAWLDTHTPDLLLLDLRMPGLDGVTVLKCLRAQDRFRKLRAIAVTALGSDADVMRTWEAGFDGHLVKPVDLETLAAALNRAFWAHSEEVRFAVSHGHEDDRPASNPRALDSRRQASSGVLTPRPPVGTQRARGCVDRPGLDRGAEVAL